MKKTLALILAIIMIVSAVAIVSAEEVPEDYCLYALDGMQRVFVTSSIIDKNPDLDAGLLVDHRTGTSLTFDFTDKESKSVSFIFGSRECEKIEKFALIIDHDEATSVEVKCFVTNDADLKTWMPVNVKGEIIVSVDENGNETAGANEDGWKVLNLAELTQGYAFYRIDFEIYEGDVFTLSELAFFRTADAEAEEPAAEEPAAPTTFVEKEPWRKVVALTRGRLF